MGGTSSESRSDLIDLLEAARGGDAEAFGELYRAFLGDVREFCARRISDPLRAEDLAQETFLKAYGSIRTFRAGSPFWPWLSTIARNLCIDELRSRGRTKEDPSADPIEPTLTNASADVTAEEAVTRQSREQIRRILRSALERLSNRDRQTLWSHAVEEESWEQIAQANGSTVHAVRNSAWRARNHLRAILDESLRGLRSRIAFPLAALTTGWRKARDRRRSRFADEHSAAAMIAIEGTASLLVGFVISAAMLSGPQGSTSAAPSDHRPLTLDASRAETPRIRAAGARVSSAESPILDQGGLVPVEATLRTKTREGAAAPSGATYRLEVYTPNGELLYAEETTFKCGDGRASELLPPTGPIKAYC